MPTEHKCEIDFLALEQFIGRRIQRTAESRGNSLSFDMLRIRDGDHLNPGHLERIKIERDMPVAGFQQCNFHACSPLVQSAARNAAATLESLFMTSSFHSDGDNCVVSGPSGSDLPSGR
ncbi:hypothetical protein D3C71_1675150 [compost metagenome]